MLDKNGNIDKDIDTVEKKVEMSKEAFYELIDNLEHVDKLTSYGKKAIKENVNNLKQELATKDKMIDLIIDKFIEGTEYYYSEFDNMSKEDIKEYFRKRAKNG